MFFKKARDKARDSVQNTKAFRWLEGTYPYKFTIGLKNENLFWSRFNGAVNGAILVAEACLFGAAWGGLHFLPKQIPQMLSFAHVAPIAALPLLPHIAVIAGFCALTAVGACAIGYGLASAWKSMEGLCERIFPKFNPLRKIRVRTSKALVAFPPARQLHNGIKKYAARPGVLAAGSHKPRRMFS